MTNVRLTADKNATPFEKRKVYTKNLITKLARRLEKMTRDYQKLGFSEKQAVAFDNLVMSMQILERV